MSLVKQNEIRNCLKPCSEALTNAGLCHCHNRITEVAMLQNPVLNAVLSEDDLISIGFERMPHFTIANTLIYNLGRHRHLSVGCVGTPNEILFVCQTQDHGRRNVTDSVCLHNYDYDGFLTKDKLERIVQSIGKSKHGI